MGYRELFIQLMFRKEICFLEDSELAVYKIIMKRLKGILCIDSEAKSCASCDYKEKCIYSYLTGTNFTSIEECPVILRRNILSKKCYREGESLDLTLIFLGEAGRFTDYFKIILAELQTRGLLKEAIPFSIEALEVYDKVVEDNNSMVFNILTPITSKGDILKEEYKKIHRLNRLHKIIELSEEDIPEHSVKLFKYDNKKNIFIGEGRYPMSGYLGRINFTGRINLSWIKVLKIIGLGRYYAIGGGRISE